MKEIYFFVAEINGGLQLEKSLVKCDEMSFSPKVSLPRGMMNSRKILNRLGLSERMKM